MLDLDTAPFLALLKAYRANDATLFKSKFLEMKQPRNLHWSLASRLASFALADRNAEMLKAVLEIHDSKGLHWLFNADYNYLKHEGTQPEIIRIIESSGFQSMVPPGKRFSDLHPLDYL